MKSKHVGSSFDDFLKSEGIREEATGHAIKRVIAWQLAEAMKAKKISKMEIARQLKTSRTQIISATLVIFHDKKNKRYPMKFPCP